MNFPPKPALLLAALLFACAQPSGARPAPWYRWQSESGDMVCAQTSPGPGWFRLNVVYIDPRCQRRDEEASRALRESGGK